MERIDKTFVAETKNADPKTGEIEVLIPLSSGRIDRDGEVVEPSAFKRHLSAFKKRPVLVSSHDYRDLRKQIGEFAGVRVTEDGLYGKPRYYINQGNQEADWGFFLASIGKAAFSIGFLPIAWDENPEGDGWRTPRKTFTEVELLEVSHVIVPANREAAQAMKEELCVKGIDPPPEFRKAIDGIIKPETTEDYFRVPVPGEEGKHDGHRIRTITISENDGIKALYCGECKVVITYLFSRDDKFGWTMARAQAWVREHSRDFNPAGLEVKTAIPYHRTPLADEGAEWDAAAEVQEAEVEDLKIMCAVIVGDPENKTSYKLPHHRASGEHACVWRAVANCAAVLMGARGGVQMPAGDEAAVKAHIGRHYADFDKGDPPWKKELSWEAVKDEFDYIETLIKKEKGAEPEVQACVWNMARTIMGIPGGQIPVDIEAKIGAVLNAKNKEKLRQAQALIQDVLDSAEPEPEASGAAISTADYEAKIAAMVNSALRKYIKP